MAISQINANSIATGVPTASQGSSMVLIGSATASSSALVSFTGLSLAGYSAIQVVCNNLTVATNGVNLQCQMSTGGTFQTSGYAHVEWRWVAAGQAASGSSTDTQININSAGDSLSNSATVGNGFNMYIYGPGTTTFYKQYTSQFSGLASDDLG
jgi:hypothetical protein